jgi:hypothetical protein
MWSIRLFVFALAIVAAGCETESAPSVDKLSDIAPTEGMWLPNALPADRLDQQFHFRPTAQWADALRLSSVQIGASGSFVSPDGLILTNHHVAASGLENISSPGNDYLATGFLAKTRDQEVRLPGQSVEVLQSIEDVTNRVNAAVDPTLPPVKAVAARHAIFATIERESLEKTGLQSSVVTLYGGAIYDLYRYKRYTDIRIVFAPEASAAFFGGDPDNFEYPRFCLDIALLRAYENGKPAHVSNYLRLSTRGVAEGDLVFVSGHPGRTDRLLTVSELIGQRDVTLPLNIENLERTERALLDYSARGDEQHRQAQEAIFGVQNSLKASRPRLAALEGEVIQRKQREEDSLRAAVFQRADLRADDAAWNSIDAAELVRARIYLRYSMLESAWALNSVLFSNARTLVRAAAEDAKPDDQRIPAFTKSNRESLERNLLADYPVYPELEIAKLTASLQFLRDKLGNDEIVQTILRGEQPAQRARELVENSKLGNAAERKRIYAAGAAEIAASGDSMIVLARLIDGESRELRTAMEGGVTEPETQAMAEINHARFALLGTNMYPDATGTLRLAYGIVKGYEQDGIPIPPWTNFAGAYEHETEHGSVVPFKLPASWVSARTRLNLQTPLNFVCTADITGGNSGSPVVNRAGELVGVIFDSNRQGVAMNFAYTDNQARAVAVDSRAILEGLSRIYGADSLVQELTAAP